MSLNWREIDQILEELDLSGAHIQQIMQPDFRTLVLELYRPAGRLTILISLEQGATRIHRTERRFKKNKTPQRFETALRARIRGGRIVEVEHVEHERIIRIDIRRTDALHRLWIRLWGGAANVILTDEHDSIVDAFYRRPKRGEVSGGRFDIESELAGRRGGNAGRFVVRDYTEYVSLNAAVDAEYTRKEKERRLEQLRSEATKSLRDADRRLTARISGLRAKTEAAADSESDRKCGDLILANLHHVSRGSDRLIAEDWSSDADTIEIPLDPRRSPQENAEQYYQRAKKRARESSSIAEQLSAAETRRDRIREQLAELPSIESERELHELLRELRGERQDSRTGEKGGGDDLPGLRFRRHGFTIHVGRNARENDLLLRHVVRGNDTWIHTRDYAGGYVFVRSIPGKSIPLDVLLDAAQLAIRYSKAPQASSAVDLYYTQVKYLRRAKDGPTGLVLPTREKNLSVEPDEARLRAIFDGR